MLESYGLGLLIAIPPAALILAVCAIGEWHANRPRRRRAYRRNTR